MSAADRLRVFTVGRRCLAVIAWLMLAIVFVSPVTKVLEPTLDSSVRGTYAYFVTHGFQYGSQVNTTAGPYGFVPFGWDYSGELFWVRFALDVLCALTTATLALWFFVTAPIGITRWAWLAVLVLGTSIGDNLFAIPVVLCGLFLLVNYERPKQLLPSLGVAAYLALLALMKATQLAMAGVVFCSIAVLAFRLRHWRRAAWITGAFLGALLSWWIGAGQHLASFPAYVDGARRIAKGYNEAMAVDESRFVLVVGASLLLVFLTALGWIVWQRRKDSVWRAAGVLLAGIVFISWKHGYVRADGHVYIFLDFALILTVSLPLLARLRGTRMSRLPEVVFALLVLAAVGTSLGGAETLLPRRLHWLVTTLPARWFENARYVLAPAQIKRERDEDLLEQKREYDLRGVRSVVQRQSIDFFGYEMGLLLLNGLNYQPAPMCCATYHVYNRHFKELNRRHFADPTTRPQYILLKTQTIDHRLMSQDDSLSLLALLDLYQPVLEENRTVLLQSRGSGPSLQHARPLASRRIHFDEEVAVPTVGENELLLFSVTLPPSLLGRLRSFAYKPPPVWMDLAGDGLEEPVARRVIPGSVAVPCLLSPALEKTSDFLALYTRQSAKSVHRFRLYTTQPSCFDQSEFEVHFFVIDRPPYLPPDQLRHGFDPHVYHDAPVKIEPADALVHVYQGRRVQYLHAPTRITYDLRGDERAVSMLIGIDQDAYLKGRTDGVDFSIELQRPGQPTELLKRRSLKPLTVPADRGLFRFAAPLPPAFESGTKLIIRTDPGPEGDRAWDWAFATDVALKRGPYAPEQFPRFSPLPIGVEGNSISQHGVNDRDVVMTGPTCAILFNLTGAERTLRFTAGLLEASYTTGNTDGVVFAVEYVFGDGRTKRIYNRWLQPKSVPADRGPQAFTVPLQPMPAGTRLRLSCDPGPAGDISWDWAYVSELSLR